MSNIRQIMHPAEVAITIASKHNCMIDSQNMIRTNVFISIHFAKLDDQFYVNTNHQNHCLHSLKAEF